LRQHDRGAKHDVEFYVDFDDDNIDDRNIDVGFDHDDNLDNDPACDHGHDGLAYRCRAEGHDPRCLPGVGRRVQRGVDGSGEP
jgi:hypothetical protein